MIHGAEQRFKEVQTTVVNNRFVQPWYRPIHEYTTRKL